MPNNFKLKKLPILSILEQKSRKYAPPYQRNFAWEKENIQELWDDIIEVIFNNGNEHFLGVLILSARENDFIDEGDETKDVIWDITDGQQRLAVFTILLRAMRDKVIDTDPELGATIYGNFIQGDYSTSGSYYKLELNKLDQPFFEGYIQDKERPMRDRKGKTKPQKRIAFAYNFFLNEIKKESEGRGITEIEFVKQLYDKLSEKAVAVTFRVISEVEAYSIFETINSKRADLTVADLLKNYLLSRVEEIAGANSLLLRKTIKDWEAMQTNFSGLNIDISTFIRHYWISTTSIVREKQLYRTIKTYFRSDTQKIRGFPKNLYNESSLYSALIDPDGRDVDLAAQNSELLKGLHMLKIKQAYPIILSGLAKNIETNNLEKILKKIITISLRRSIVGKNPNELESLYAEKAKRLRTGGDSAVEEIINELDKFWIEDEEFTPAFKNRDFHLFVAKFILWHQELDVITEEKDLSKTKLSIEHILPQNPENIADWNMTPEEHEEYNGKIGNLVLLGKRINSSISNKSYSDKKPELINSSIIKTSELATSHNKWEKADIDGRGEDLLEFVLRAWPRSDDAEI